MIGCWYEIEEEIPKENSIGGNAFWTALSDGFGNCPARLDYRISKEYLIKLTDQGRKVRIVRVIREVCGNEE